MPRMASAMIVATEGVPVVTEGVPVVMSSEAM